MSAEERRLDRALVEAIGLMELELPARAVERLQRVAEIGERQVHWNALTGEALRNLERFQEALPFLERARELAPEQLDLYLSLGWCYKRIAQLPLAIRALEAAHRLQPDSDLVLYNLACYHCLAGNKKQTLDYLSRALRHSDRWRDHVKTESDFDGLREDADFQQLIATGKS